MRSEDYIVVPRRVTFSAFTLVELLVVIAIIAVLIAIVLPALRGARDQARAAACASNIRQIAIANIGYAVENNGRFCPGAADYVTNLHRWHGLRASTSDAFRPQFGPLTPYLGNQMGVRACPSFRRTADATPAFEHGSGGYGYNLAYLGRVLRSVGFGFFVVQTDLLGVISERVDRPAQTLMFADTAFAATSAGLIEYSFAEPRFHPTNIAFRADPSIHFRHRKSANIAWVDSHVDRHRRTFTYSSGLYPGDAEAHHLGWFGLDDSNQLFDLQ